MPNTKSAVKDIKQSAKRRALNDNYKQNIKEVSKKDDLQQIYKSLDKGVKRGVITKARAARKKSQAWKALRSSGKDQVAKI